MTHEHININEASKEDLMQLAGIGAGTAEDIIQYRETHGKFRSLDDLAKVRNIKQEYMTSPPGRLFHPRGI